MTHKPTFKATTKALQERDRLEVRIKAHEGKPGVNALRQKAKDRVEAILSAQPKGVSIN